MINKSEHNKQIRGNFTMSSYLVEVEDLSVTFGSYHALQHISLKIPPGEYWVVIGENGAGKSSLLRCLALWARPTGGIIRIDGYEAFDQERHLRSRIKFVPDTPSFYAELTALEHAQLVGSLNRLPEWKTQARELFRAFSLDQHLNAYPLAFSRGMQYKLALLLCMLTKPSLLLLDEPFGPLDPASQSHLTDLLGKMAREQGTTVLVTTHVLPEVADPDHLVFLNRGQISVDWSWEQVLTQFPGNIATLPYRMEMAKSTDPQKDDRQ